MSENHKQNNTGISVSAEVYKIQKKEVSNENSRNQNDDNMTASYSEIVFDSHYFNSRKKDEVDRKCTPNKEPCDKIQYLQESSDEETDVNEQCEINRKLEAPERPESLNCDKAFPYSLEGTGTISKLGNMTHFVAENFQFKIKNSNPVIKKGHNPVGTSSSKNSTPSTSTTGFPQQFFSSNQQPQIDSNVLNDIEIEAQYLAASVDILCENLCNLLHSISSITADNVEIHKNAVNKLTDNMDANIKCMYTIMAKTEEISKSMRPTEVLAQKIREIKRLVDMLDNNV